MNHSSMKKYIFIFLAFGCLFICTNNLTAGEIESNFKNVFVGTYLFTTQYDWNIQSDGVSLEKSKPNILKKGVAMIDVFYCKINRLKHKNLLRCYANSDLHNDYKVLKGGFQEIAELFY